MLLLVGMHVALAQEAPGASATAGPEVIAAADIPARAEIDERFAEEVLQRAAAPNPADALEPELESLSNSVRELGQRYQKAELDLLPINLLESLDRHWQFLRGQVDAWRNRLRGASVRYLEDASDLSRRAANWKATRDAMAIDTATAALGERIAAAQALLDQAGQALSDPLNKQIQLSQRGYALEDRVQSGRKAVVEAIAFNDRRLARVDAPPLWDSTGQESSDSVLEALRAGSQLESEFMAQYSAAHEVARRLYYVFAAVLLPALLWLWLRSRKQASDNTEIEASLRVLRRPFASWLLLVASGVLVIAARAPISLIHIALFATLIPVLRLLPHRVYQVLGSWPYVVSALYLANRLDIFFLANSFYHRCYLLFLTMLTLSFLVWRLLRSRPHGRADGGHAGGAVLAVRILRVASWLAVMLMAISGVAVVFGNVSLAEMLTDAVLFSGYVGLVLYAGVNVLASMLYLLLARPAIARIHLIAEHGAAILRGVTRLLTFGAAAGWILITLDQFRLSRPLYRMTHATLTYRLGVGELSVSLGGVLTFALSVYLAFWIAKSVRVLLRDEVLTGMSLPRGAASSISSLTYYALLLIGLFMALAAAGFEIGRLAIVLGALSVGIGLGLQNIVQNFVSGLVLMFERPVYPGDVIEVGGTSGRVREIGMRATTLATFEGADVVVPNGTLLSEKLINWTLSDMNRRIEVNVGVAYGTQPRQVLDLLLQVTGTTPGIIAHPLPAALFVGFGESSLNFTVRAWTDNFDEWVNIRSDLTMRIHDAISAAGIQIPFPQRDLHLRSIAPEVTTALTQQHELNK